MSRPPTRPAARCWRCASALSWNAARALGTPRTSAFGTRPVVEPACDTTPPASQCQSTSGTIAKHTLSLHSAKPQISPGQKRLGGTLGNSLWASSQSLPSERIYLPRTYPTNLNFCLPAMYAPRRGLGGPGAWPRGQPGGGRGSLVPPPDTPGSLMSAVGLITRSCLQPAGFSSSVWGGPRRSTASWLRYLKAFAVSR